MLRGVITPDERVLVGPLTVDDAGVVVLGAAEGLSAGSQCALVQTVDYFPPVVDDPYWYGAIAAANALSDVYAMGGRPFSALNLAGFPKDFPPDWIAAILRGGFDKMREAGAMVVGGHTVQSKEALFGFAVTGVVHPGRVVANSGARPGDVLVLTKPLGMGTMTTAAKKGVIPWGVLEPAARQMATLNAAAAEAMVEAGASACTDVTGFGLAGHAKNLAGASGVTVHLALSELPLFPGALELARAGHLSGGARRGREGLASVVHIAEGLDPTCVALVFDAETSGGLLIAIPPARLVVLEAALASRGVTCARVGRCVARGAAGIEVELEAGLGDPP